MSATCESWSLQISSGAWLKVFNLELPWARLARVRRSLSSFQVLGISAIMAAVSLHIALTRHSGLPLSLSAAVSTVSLATFVFVALLTRIITGKERLVYYRQAAAIYVANALLFKLVGLDFLRSMDVFAVCFGLFLAIARLGCLSVGCCHGRPWRWGVRYGPEQVETGFPSWLEGVRLFPVQAVESIWVCCIVVTGTAWLWRGAVPGAVFGFTLLAYGGGRFFLEFLRGDEGRTYFFYFSEAQWTSLVLIAAVGLAQARHWLPSQFFAMATLVFLLTAPLSIALFRWMGKPGVPVLFSAKHINEIARSLEVLSKRHAASTKHPRLTGPSTINMVRTSQRLQISLGHVRRLTGSLVHFTVSRGSTPLSASEAKSLATLLAHCSRSAHAFVIIPTSRAVYHILAAEDSSSIPRCGRCRPGSCRCESREPCSEGRNPR